MAESNSDGEKNKKGMFSGLIAGLAVMAVIGLVMVLAVKGPSFFFGFGGLSATAAAAKAESFVNDQLLNGQGGATVKVVGPEGDLYKLEVTYQGKKIDSYMTRDGKKFFPQAVEMNAAANVSLFPTPCMAKKKTRKICGSIASASRRMPN